MGSSQDYCRRSHKFTHLFISFFLLVSSSTQVRLMAEGRVDLKLIELTDQMGREEKAVVRSHIGSRPPTCEKKCSSCGHCVAIQVPADPQKRSGDSRHSSKVSTIAYSRGEDNSNYKPMSWKCKCGDRIFNP
ncbi:hypothetical protein NE237_022620 [Protea cynaroides]|uniref:Epidermal patterning factor-like protein n=1 Tax=Protea cynaroides TaxID=273540 RepID=A0A9Q0HCD6_9MAGN|nr:hypothetical protein NE237_022620 [Protea cynaroides]